MRMHASDGVFNRMPVTSALERVLESRCDGKAVLDMCCGPGTIGISTMIAGDPVSVTFVDVFRTALSDVEENLSANKVSIETSIIQSDYFESVPGTALFDVIVSNPPCMPLPENAIWGNDGLTLAINGGPRGDKGLVRVLRGALKHLRKDGVLIVPLPSWSDLSEVNKLIDDLYNSKVLSDVSVNFYPASQMTDDIRTNLQSLIQEEAITPISGSTNKLNPWFRVDIVELTPRDPLLR